MLGAKIAIGGKGGVGKTTVCAVWAQLFAEDGFDVLAIDADPNTNLSLAFGIPSEQCGAAYQNETTYCRADRHRQRCGRGIL